MTNFNLHRGDCIAVLKTLPDNSVDSIVTDPPYGLSEQRPAELVACLAAWLAGDVYQPKGKGFMGKAWDAWVPGPEVWRECFRVLKPGGHILAFAGTRTQHLMALSIALAGFEIRDLIAWVYGSGFPKSLDVSKAIDKVNGEPNRLHKFTKWMRTTGLSAKQINDATGTFMGSHYLTAGRQPSIPTSALWERLRPLCGDVPAWVDELVRRIEAEREVVGLRADGAGNGSVVGLGSDRSMSTVFNITAPATDAARQWQGWGTALKPALEPITFARKPLAGTVAANVLEFGTGGINIDGCRVHSHDSQGYAYTVQRMMPGAGQNETGKTHQEGVEFTGHTKDGRWPANLIHSGESDAVAGLGGAARYFYCAKASKSDRGAGNAHPTVKPTDLMRYLCRLVTPPGGMVLDPFMGSGSTGKATMLEGFNFVGIERDADENGDPLGYMDIARARIEAAARAAE